MIINNRYTIEKFIGKGHFGVVYKGQSISNAFSVAIKYDHNNVGIVKHEAKMLNYLQEKNMKKIPLVYWFGVCFEPFHKKNLPCLIMPFYDCSLTTYMKNNEITKKNLSALMIFILKILENIHTRYVIHRDIKPDNFMIKGGDVFLIDFGFSTFYVNDKFEHTPLLVNKNIVGTPLYISHNTHCGITPSRRDDLISLGYLYLKMLMGYLEWENNDTCVSLNFLKKYSMQIMLKEKTNFENIDDALFEEDDKIKDVGEKLNTDIYNAKNVNMCFLKTFEHIKNTCEMINDKKIFLYLQKVYSLNYKDEPDYKELTQLFLSSLNLHEKTI